MDASYDGTTRPFVWDVQIAVLGVAMQAIAALAILLVRYSMLLANRLDSMPTVLFVLTTVDEGVHPTIHFYHV
jgi:hypothetical protein